MKSDKRLSVGFRWAIRGVWTCIREERNFRIHLAAVFYSTLLGLWMPLNPAQWCVLILTQGAVLAMELLNTAIEAVVDLCCPQPHPLAAKAKDMGAGAVLVAAAASVGVGIGLFWNRRLVEFFFFFVTTPWALLGLTVSAVLFMWFIFGV